MGDERLGRYTVLKHLATGGMADVLLGRADGIEGFERHVVLKRIRAEHAKDQRFIQMFLDEARLSASLHHQNIVQVHDVGESAGEYFFAMEYLHGEDLRKLLSSVSKKRSHMPLGYACAIVSAVAAGLHYAHERKDSKGRPLGIVHRDVSPSNVLIGYDGAIKVVDFGIAKAAARQQETRSGSLKGKVSYMSPEQCKGADIDRRSDVWALGVLLYELATTTRLFKGENDYLQMDAIVNGKIPAPRVRRPDLPVELSSIIMKALEVDPDRRYATADELRLAVDHFAIKAGITASTSAIGGYMHKLFGTRPEPWLDDAGPAEPHIDVDAPTAAARRSWTELPVAVEPVEDTASGANHTPATGTRRRSGIVNAVALSDTIAPPMAGKRETRTSMNMGFEAQASSPPVPATVATKKLAWIAGAIVVVLALIVWKLASSGAQHPVAAAPPPPAPAAPVVAAAPEPPKHEIPTVRVAGFESSGEPVAVAPPVDKTRRTSPAPAPRPAKGKAATVATPPAPVPAPAPTPAAVAPPPAPAPAPAPPPVEPEIVIPTISSATVSAIASDNSRQLAKCDGSEELHGEVAVAFQIDATGHVVKSQLSSSIKNPKVAACILKAVQSWKFPKPPSGSAKGVYSINYQ